MEISGAPYLKVLSWILNRNSIAWIFNPIPTTKKSYIKDHPRAESALVYLKSNLVLSPYYSDIPDGVVVSTTDL